MKLVSFRENGAARFGAVKNGGIVDLTTAAGPDVRSLADAVRRGEFRRLAEIAAGRPADRDLDEVELLPPVSAGKIICVGLNYRSHVAEGGAPAPSHPILFARYAESLVGAGQPLLSPRLSKTHDFEGELAFVIGRRAYRVTPATAFDYIAGYGCFNDGSVREFQGHTSQWLPGKNFYRSGSFGPWLVTADEITDPARLDLVTRLNGETMQKASTSDLLFTIPQIIEYVTAIIPLEPGDVVATGTTGGVGAARKPPVWMRPGDTVEVEITGLGLLKNSITGEGDFEP